MMHFRLDPPAASPSNWRQRLLGLAVSAIAIMVTVGLLVTGFFIAMAVLGLVLLLMFGFWLRRVFTGRPAPGLRAHMHRGTREPVVIDAEYVVIDKSRR